VTWCFQKTPELQNEILKISGGMCKKKKKEKEKGINERS